MHALLDRRGGPLPNCVGVKYENKNMVTGPDGALHQESASGGNIKLQQDTENKVEKRGE
jgi:hypothetical protein